MSFFFTFEAVFSPGGVYNLTKHITIREYCIWKLKTTYWVSAESLHAAVGLTSTVVFGYFWLLLVIFGYFWLFLVIFGHFWSFLVIFGHLFCVIARCRRL